MSNPTQPFDAHVGSRIRIGRVALNMTVEQLSEALGVTVQRMQEYEAGSRRIGAVGLLKLSQILKTSPSFFFEGFSEAQGSLTEGEEDRAQPLSDARRVMRIFMSIENAAARKKIIDYAASIADQVVRAKKDSFGARSLRQGTVEKSCVLGHSGTVGGGLWRSRRTHSTSFFLGAIRRRCFPRTGFLTS